MAPLGNGYDIAKADDRPYVIGGGLGVPPMYYLTEKLIESGRRPVVILGYNTSSEMFYSDKFEKLGADVSITTADGSCGLKGFVTDAFPPERPYVFACGPEPMLKAVYDISSAGQFSFEARMGCGFGACMTRETLNVEEKNAIARYAASIINDDDFIFIDAGTTTARIVDFLESKKVTIVTNGVPLAMYQVRFEH